MRASARLSPWLIISLALPPLCPLSGQRPGEPYISPLRNFSVPVPKFVFGTRIQKSNNRDGGLVVFMGGMGDLERIDYARLPAGPLATQDSAARLQGYGNALRAMVQTNHAEVVALQPLSLSGDAVLYALVRFPEASQVMEGGKRMDSFRGTLLLVRGDFLYQLAVEVGGLREAATDQERVDSGKEAVQRFLGEISFQGSPIPVVRDTTRAVLADAGQIVFSSTRDGNYEIYLVNADGSNPTRLTNHPAEDRFPAWSPDGTKIVFVSDRDGNPEIYVMNADGSSATRLTTDPAQDGLPNWLPDGKRIVFTSQRDGGAQLYLMNADGSNVAKLTSGPAMHFFPNWSPDGSRVAGVSAGDGTSGIFTMNADGSHVVQLTQGVDIHPVWSPDGTKIAFGSNRDGNSEIYVMNADGSNVTRLTRSPAADVLPTWSPDGSKLVFHSDRDGNWEIYVMNVDGTGVVNVTTNLATDVEPHWRPRR